MKKITTLAFLFTLIGIACNEGNRHPKINTYVPPAESEVAPVYSAQLIQLAEKAESLLNVSITEFEQKNTEKSADNLENALYELASEGAFFKVTDRKLLDHQLEELGTLAHLIRKGQISDVEVIKNNFARARLFLAKEILRAPEFTDVDFPEATPTAKPANATPSVPTKTVGEQLPVIMHAVQELKSAARHLNGDQLTEVESIIAKAEAVIAREENKQEKATTALEEVAGLLNTFLQTHQEEFVDLNAEFLKASEETQKSYQAHMAKLKAEIDQHTKAAQAFMKEQREEAKEKSAVK